ncbi:conserved hypothetical protein [Theileria orientalis strain Shintoku]|uniref:Uncharacterized protein n=1 Tax=Theileria orientalis strain Shintoku TaxID=869250 RepID=J4C7K4_THEOR|nr:conserved hypothetical protein [Theileria orientalis strain Shintoku]BAM39193.1 conserved hypothetical protein [Theileria orientalis strain Shintoku]|eukprot:XP_009689494.1 conserved hypothetical protein [Theileria orientalis strain Shintoku]
MKLYWFASYILVYLLTHSHWNLVVPVKAGEEDSASTADGTSGNANSVEANNVSADASEAEVSAEAGAPVSESSEDVASTLAQPANAVAVNQVPENLRGLKAFKADADGNPVLMEDKEHLSDEFMGTRTYAFKPELPCILVRFNNMDVWKRGEHSLEKPKSVTFDGVSKEITVRDAYESLFYKFDETKVWKHVGTIKRTNEARPASTDANQANSESSEFPADPNQASSVPANEAKESAEAGSTDATQAESGSTDTSEQSKDATPDADASGGSSTAADADSSGGDGSPVTNEQDSSSAPTE